MYTVENFISKSREVHGNKYNYSRVKYVDTNTPVEITCPIHGVFIQKPSKHIKGRGCKKCGDIQQGKSKALTTKTFIERASNIHNGKYDYSQVHYANGNTKVKIICPKHGVFEQRPVAHLKGIGCRFCGNEKRAKSKTKNKDHFIKLANNVHNFKYDYSKVVYTKAKVPVTIICPLHGEFETTPDRHLQGVGCYKCWCLRSKGENKIENFLTKINVRYINQYKFKGCIYHRELPFDFAVLNNDGSVKFLIEYQGEQHFKPISIFGGEAALADTQLRDKIKYNYCKEHNIPLYYITYKDNIKEKLKELPFDGD